MRNKRSTFIAVSEFIMGSLSQTIMRRYNIENPYEKLKELTRGKTITREILADFVETLEMPEDAKDQMRNLTPANYTGYAERLARAIAE